MKSIFTKHLFLLCSFFCLTFTTVAFSSTSDCSSEGSLVSSKVDSSSDEKLYLPAESLLTDAGKLYVKIEDQLYQVSSVFSDDLGIYVAKASFEERIVAVCPNGHPNPPWNLTCAVCKEPLY